MPNPTQDAPWIPLAELSPLCLDRNIEILRSIEPEFVRDIPLLKNRRDILLQRVGDYFRCKVGGSGERWVFGKDGIENEIKRYEGALGKVLPNCRNLFLVGSALGYPLVWIQKIVLNTPDLHIVLCEPDPSLLLAAFCVVDLRGYLASARYHQYLGPWTPEGMRDWLGRAGLSAPERTRTLLCSTDSPSPEALRFTDSIPSLLENSVQETNRRWGRVVERSQMPKDRRIRKILFLNAWSQLPSGIHIRAIREACERLGLGVSQFDVTRHLLDREPEAYRSRIAADLLDLLDSFQPDALLSLSYNRSSFLDPSVKDRLGIPLFQYVTTILYQRRDFSPGDLPVVAEGGLVDRLKRFGASEPVFRIMAADDIAPPGNRMENGRVIFVGSSLGLDPVKRKRFDEEWKSREKLRAFLDTAAEEISHCGSKRTLYDIVSGDIPQVDSEEDEYDVFDYLLCEGSARRRIQILEALVPLGLEIYGGDWEYILPPNHPLRGCLRGVLHPEQVPQAHLSASVVINIHSVGHVTGPNMRFFNVPGVGGVMVSDAEYEFDQLLSDGTEALFYRTPDECVEKVKWILEHNRERAELREAARARVLGEHTYDRWVKDVFTTFEYRLPV
ncbi:MAG: glycosyltransferase [bacterium]